MLIMARVMGVFFIAPVFSAQGINIRMRMIISFFISIVLYPLVVKYLPPLPESPGGFVLLVMGQTLMGICIGFIITIIFSAFHIAGQIFSVQMGLSFSQVLDPQAQLSVPVIGTLKGMIGLLLFLTVDFQIGGHYVPAYLHIIRALADSFIKVPSLIPDARVLAGMTQYIDQSLGVMFITALKIGIPIMGILFISSVALGILGRAAPQMNLLNMGIQLNIMIGIFSLITLSPVIIPLMTDAFYKTYDRIDEMLRDWPHPNQQLKGKKAE